MQRNEGVVDHLLRLFEPTTPAFRLLLEESLLNNFGMLRRLETNWDNGSNRFDDPGETLIGAWVGSDLAGVCGLNIDPYLRQDREGRVRHLYVAQAHRRAGIGRSLVGAVIEAAKSHFATLNVRAPTETHPFYESLGFEAADDDAFITHRLMLTRHVGDGSMPRETN